MNPQDILRGRAKELAGRATKAQETSGEPMLVFLLGGERYGLPLRAVAEVRPFAQCTPLPRAPAEILGVINVRGDAYSAVELAALLELPPAGADRAPGFALIMRHAGRVGLRVDAVIDLMTAAGLAPDRTTILNPEALLGHPALAGVAIED